MRERLLPKEASKKGSYLNEILFGLINVIVGVPTMVSYAAVVFKVMTLLHVVSTQVPCSLASAGPRSADSLGTQPPCSPVIPLLILSCPLPEGRQQARKQR